MSFLRMTVRVQRIASAIEIFALVMWVGSLFFFLGFAWPAADSQSGPGTMAAWHLSSTMVNRFAPLEIVFAVVVLASNFMKVLLFRNAYTLQRIALLISAIMLLFTVYNTHKLRPLIDEKYTEIAAMTEPNAKLHRGKLDKLVQRQKVLLAVNLVMGLFLVYSYRTFEDRKMQALAGLIKGA
jgi:uncharacterized membrane protein